MLIGGLVSVTFRDKSPREIIDLCVENRLKAIEWGENAHVFAGDVQGAARLGEMTRQAGLQIAGYGSYYRLDTPDQPPQDFEPTLQSALALGAPVIRVWAGRKGSEEADAAYRAQVAQKAAVIAEMAGRQGVRIAFEWHRNTLTDTNESALDLLKAANHPNLYSLWQPTPEIPCAQRREGLRALGSRLAHLHVYYWDDARKRHPFEQGLDYWADYLSVLDPRAQYYALLEFVMGDTTAQLAQDAKALLAFLEKINAQQGGK